MNKNAVQLLTNKLQGISVGDAFWLLALYGCTDDQVWTGTYWLPIHRLSEVYFDEEDAKVAKVRFNGGPGRIWYWGDLSALAIDRVLRGCANGIGFAWLLTYNPESNKTLCEQVGRFVPGALMSAPMSMNDREHEDTYDYDPVIEYIDAHNGVIAVHESGRQSLGTLSASTATSGDRIYKWSSSGRTGISH